MLDALVVAAAQMRPKLATPDSMEKAAQYNAFRVLDLAEQASRRNAKIAVFPELCITGYALENRGLVEQYINGIKHTIDAWLSGFAKERDMILAVGMPTGLTVDGINSMFFDSAVVYTPQGTHICPKSKLWYSETYLFSPCEGLLVTGEPRESLFNTIHLGETKMGASVCFDYFSDDVPAIHASLEHKIVLLPSAWAATRNQSKGDMLCHRRLQEMSLRYQQLIINGSRIGREVNYTDGTGNRISFLGGSSIVVPGRMYRNVNQEEGLLVAGVSLASLKGTPQISQAAEFFPFDPKVRYI